MNTPPQPESFEQKEREAKVETPKELAGLVLNEADEESDSLSALINLGRKSASETPASNNADWLAQLSNNENEAHQAVDELKTTVQPFVLTPFTFDQPPASENPLFQLPALNTESSDGGFNFPTLSNVDEGVFDFGKKNSETGLASPKAKLERAALDSKMMEGNTSNLENTFKDALFSSQAVSFEDISLLRELASNDQSSYEKISASLSKKIGSARAERLLKDEGYTEALHKLQEKLRKPYKEHGPYLFKEPSLEKLMIVQEQFGEHLEEMVEAFDFSKHESTLELSKRDDILLFNPETQLILEKDGTSTSEVLLQLGFSDREGKTASIKRSFKEIRSEDGEAVTKKNVNHQHFSLDPKFQGSSLASFALGEALPVYDKLNIDNITTHANIDMGGYVWQSYGFEWDPDSESEATVRIHVRKAKELAVDRLKSVGLVDEAGRSSNPDIQAALAQFDDLAEHPEKCSPQTLGNIGRDSLKLYRWKEPEIPGTLFSTAEEEWFTEGQFKSASQSGRWNEEQIKQMQGNAYHLGKLGMAHGDFDWYGAVPLKPKDHPARAMYKKQTQKGMQKRKTSSTL